MSVPENIKQKRPSCFGPTEIRALNGRYYVYLVTYERPPDGGWIKKVTGKCVGQITEENGFVPNANGLRYLASSPSSYSIYKYGAYETAALQCCGMENRMRDAFPREFPYLKVVSLIEFIDDPPSSLLLNHCYQQSFLAVQYPHLELSSRKIGSVHRIRIPPSMPERGRIDTDRSCAVQYMKEIYRMELSQKLSLGGLSGDFTPQSAMEVLNSIYRIRTPASDLYMLSDYSALAGKLLSAFGVSFEPGLSEASVVQTTIK